MPSGESAPVVPLMEKDETLVDQGAAIHSLDPVWSLATLPGKGTTNSELMGVPAGNGDPVASVSWPLIELIWYAEMELSRPLMTYRKWFGVMPSAAGCLPAGNGELGTGVSAPVLALIAKPATFPAFARVT